MMLDAFIEQHFKKHVSANQFQCRYCGSQGRLEGNYAQKLHQHIQMHHPHVLEPTGKKAARDDAHTYGDTRDGSDEWLDRLALGGYNVPAILNSILLRYKENSMGFGKHLIKRAAALKACKYKVKNYLPKLPLTIPVRELIKHLTHKYPIHPDGAQLLLEDFHWVYQDEYEVLSELAKRGISILKHQEGRSNKVILLCDEVMKENYDRFGDVVCINFMPVRLAKLEPGRNVRYVGFFTGQDTNLHHAMFAVAILDEEIYENYYISFRLFMKAMKTRTLPQTFIAGSFGHLYDALRRCRNQNLQDGSTQDFRYLISWHHLTDKFNRLLEAHPDQNKEQLIKAFLNFLSSLNKCQLQQKAKHIIQISPENQKVREFLAEHIKFMTGSNEPSFVGFSIDREHTSMLYKIMHSFFKETESIGFLIHNALRMHEMFHSRTKKGYEIMPVSDIRKFGLKDETQELRYLTTRLEKKLLKKFLFVYNIAINWAHIISQSEDGLCYQVVQRTQNTFPYNSYIYTVRYSLEDECWRCNCGFIYESGIPCWHLIRVVRSFGGSLIYYIDGRWIINQDAISQEYIENQHYDFIRAQQIKMQQIQASHDRLYDFNRDIAKREYEQQYVTRRYKAVGSQYLQEKELVEHPNKLEDEVRDQADKIIEQYEQDQKKQAREELFSRVQRLEHEERVEEKVLERLDERISGANSSHSYHINETLQQ